MAANQADAQPQHLQEAEQPQQPQDQQVQVLQMLQQMQQQLQVMAEQQEADRQYVAQQIAEVKNNDLLTDLVLLARAFFGYVSHRVARPSHEKLA